MEWMQAGPEAPQLLAKRQGRLGASRPRGTGVDR
jgi:hypothetical protein